MAYKVTSEVCTVSAILNNPRMLILTLYLGECVTVMISAIWPSYRNLPNTIPAGAGVTTQGFVSFFLFWLGSLPALWFPVHQIRHLFTVKAFYSPIAAIAFFAWAISRAHGIGPIVHQPATISGGALGWEIVKGIMSCIGNFAALIMNDPDFSRFARKPKDALWSQLFTIPIGFGITSFIGIIVSSSASVIYGEEVWNPLTLLDKFLDGASSGQRFGIFIIALGFTLAQLGTNISANSVSAGTDLTALLPKYLNIRRGSYICAAISLAMCPVSYNPGENSIEVNESNKSHQIVETCRLFQPVYHLPISLLPLPLSYCRPHDR